MLNNVGRFNNDDTQININSIVAFNAIKLNKYVCHIGEYEANVMDGEATQKTIPPAPARRKNGIETAAIPAYCWARVTS